MSSSIILNTSNIVPNTNNTTLRYKFQTPQKFDDGSQVAVRSIQMYNSIFNIDKNLYNNHKFCYYWLNSSGALDTNTAITVTIPDGNYTTADINEIFMATMLKNKHYVVSSTDPTKITFFYSFVDNPVTLKCRLTVYPFFRTTQLGTSLGKYLYPNLTINNGGQWTLPVANSLLGRIEFFNDTSNKLSYFLGFTGRTIYKTITPLEYETNSRIYPNKYGFNEVGDLSSLNQTVNYQVESESIPVQQPISSIVVTSNLAKNEMSYPDNVLHSFVFKSNSGYINSEEPSQLNFMKCQSGTYSYVDISFLSQDFEKINIRDSQMLVQLIFRQVK